MKYVLSMDGGGIRGIIPAMVLAEIERKTGKRAVDLFHLVAGTSTGGIVALLLAAGYSAEEAAGMYIKEGANIFARPMGRRLSSFFGLTGPKYDHRPLTGILNRYFGNKALGDAALPTMVCCYDVLERQPVFLKSWQADSAQKLMWATARATSAAPTYFDPMEMNFAGEEWMLIDGGVAVNNPAASAAAEARKMFGPDLMVVSIGTGKHTRRLDTKGWGLAQWAVPVIDVCLDGQSDVVDYQLKHLLGDRFLRLQTELTLASDDMDDASNTNLRKLESEARWIIKKYAADIDRLCAELVG